MTYDAPFFFGYRDQIPDRCCALCAYSDSVRADTGATGVPCECAVRLGLMRVFYNAGKPFEIDDFVGPTSVCDKFLPRRMALVAARSRSFEELRLKFEIEGLGAPPQELADFFAERQATPAQTKYMLAVLPACAAPPPLMADVATISEDGRVSGVGLSSSFYTVQKWLSDALDAAEAKPRPDREKLRQFMAGRRS